MYIFKRHLGLNLFEIYLSNHMFFSINYCFYLFRIPVKVFCSNIIWSHSMQKKKKNQHRLRSRFHSLQTTLLFHSSQFNLIFRFSPFFISSHFNTCEAIFVPFYGEIREEKLHLRFDEHKMKCIYFEI